MKRLLRLDCSARIADSQSRELADYFENKWREIHVEGVVIRRDLTKQLIPHIQQETIEGFYTPDEHMTLEIREATVLSDELVAELKSVNEILISSPLYNLNVPSTLKAYLDQVVRIGQTFGTDENGFYGLLEHKTAHLITAKGAVYQGTPAESYDFQTPYLQAILGFMGIKEQYTYSLEGTSGDAQLLAESKAKIQQSISSTLMGSVEWREKTF